MTNQTLRYGAQQVRYRIAFWPTPGRKIAIHVLPSGSLQIDAPQGTALAEIKSAVAKRAAWICKHQQEIRDRTHAVLRREYVSGESHYYLGRRYLLKVRTSIAEPASVALRRGRFEIVGASRDAKLIRSLLWGWYRQRAQRIFDESLAHWGEKLSWLDQPPSWKLLTMKRQWGSCSPDGFLTLNTHLIKAPRNCIDYVQLHELCHLRFHNHGDDFHRLLGQHMPDWRTTKLRLDGMAEALLSK